jgi:hypothetical protein
MTREVGTRTNRAYEAWVGVIDWLQMVGALLFVLVLVPSRAPAAGE